jgi:Lon protease-like protein
MSPHRSHIEVLGIQIDSAWRGPSSRILVSIADSPYLRRLERLHIPSAGDAGHAPRLDVATVRRLFDSPNLQNLQTLDLRNTHATTDVWEEILESPLLRRLQTLYLAGTFEILRSGRQQALRDHPRWREAFAERVPKVDWSWGSIGIADGTWPAAPVERRRDEMRMAMHARPLPTRRRTSAAPPALQTTRPSRRRCPVLAARGTVIFPDAVERLVIGRPQSIMAVDAAIERGGELVVAAQKMARSNAPAADDIHAVGTLCSIVHAASLPDGTRVTLLAGRSRVRIERLESSDAGYFADVEEIDEPFVDGADVDALIAGLRAIVAALPKDRMPAEAVDLARTTFDPRLLADVISGSIRELAEPARDFAVRQELLETTNPTARLKRLLELLDPPRRPPLRRVQ